MNRPNFFYHSVPKQPEDMTVDELDREIEACESWAEDCRRIGQGINSKETVRRRRCEAERDRRSTPAVEPLPSPITLIIQD